MNGIGVRLTGIPLLLVLAATCAASAAHAFCGFYVAKADTKLFNRASQVVLVREDDRTVLTMASDYEGDPKEFALVVPVPTFITREQIHVANRALIEHLDAYTSPRLVEYFDDNPCEVQRIYKMDSVMVAPASEVGEQRARSLGVTIEAEYVVGEYDIVILSAEQSGGLLAWLRQQGYRLPDGAEAALAGYLAAGMKFFLAKVNLEEQSKLGFSYLRPLQVAFESADFMLPLRLGMLNATGPQELLVFLLTRAGRVEAANYRTLEIPSDLELPLFVEDEFGAFYRATFDALVARESMRAVFLEYAWDMGWCDPCAADPLSFDELRELGAFWILDQIETGDPTPRPVTPDVFEKLKRRLEAAGHQPPAPAGRPRTPTGGRGSTPAGRAARRSRT